MLSLTRPIVLLLLVFMLVSCSGSINQDDLQGNWSYIKVESPSNPEENLTEQELLEQKPSISFTSHQDLTIMWGGKRLSYGKFRIEGNLIRYTENLSGGQTREFPFLVSKLTEKELVFETMEQNATRVTAIKINTK